jgi:DNA-binding GntR family transcriptional regulator
VISESPQSARSLGRKRGNVKIANLAVARATDAEPLKRQMLAEHAYERLKELILDRHIAPDSWMAVDVLARDLGVSPTPIREAMGRLERDGLIRKMENGRYRTEPLLTRASFDQLYDVRLQLEPFAAESAAKYISNAELAVLRKIELSMHAAPTGNVYAQFAQFTAANAAFHELIAKAARNQFLYDAIYRLHSHHRLAQLYLHHGIVDAAPALEEHAAIVGALASRAARSACGLMRKHIERSRRQLQDLVEEGGMG